MDLEPASRLIGYHPERLGALVRSTAAAVEQLGAVRSVDPFAAPSLAVAARAQHELATYWLPALVRVAGDRSMAAWTSDVPPPLPAPSERVEFLLHTALGRLYLDVIEVIVEGDLGDGDGYTSAEDIARAAGDPERVRRLVDEWGELHGIDFSDATLDHLTAEIVATALAMAGVDGEPWNEMRGSFEAAAEDAMLAVIGEQPAIVALDLVAAAGDPELAARWWATLPPGERDVLVADRPGLVGAVDGLPAAVRDLANRGGLAADLDSSDAEARRHAEHVAEYLEEAARHVDPRTGAPVVVQLYVYESAAFGGDGRVAVALGDIDTADHVAVAVPGFGSNVANMTPAEPLRIYDQARLATGGDDGTDDGTYDGTVAVLDWMGYDAPSFELPAGALSDGDAVDALSDVVAVVGQGAAREGARLLASDVAGVVALRDAGAGAAHVTVIGHSYGSTTVATAAADFGLAADDVVLTGSPGAGSAGSAEDLVTGGEHTWVASPSTDPVTYLGHSDGGIRLVGALGNDPAMDTFGAQRIRSENAGRGSLFGPADWLAEHDGQFLAGSESLANVAAIVAGDYDAVLLAEPRTQEPLVEWDWPPHVHPWPHDPEATRPVPAP